MSRRLLAVCLVAVACAPAQAGPQETLRAPAIPGRVVAAPVAVTLKTGVAAAGMPAVKTAAVPALVEPAAPVNFPPTLPSGEFGDNPAAALAELGASARPELAAAAFDHSRPSAALAQDIATAGSVDEAVARAQAKGALSSTPSHPTLRLFQLKRLWDAHAPALVGRRFSIDESWAIPAIKVTNGETTYLVHPYYHGVGFASGRGRLLELVRQIARRGDQLYSEENAWAFFGFRFGKEIDDLSSGAAAVARDFAFNPEYESLVARFKASRSQTATLYVVVAGAAAAGVGLAFGLGAGAAAAVLALLGLWQLVTGRRGIETGKDLVAAARARMAGLPDVAAQLRREAFALNRKLIDPLDVLRLQLPPGLGPDRYAVRSDALAAAVRGDVGPKIKHVFVGAAHAARVAWRLSAPEGPGEESQRV